MDLDAWIAGYATRVARHSLPPSGIPELPDLLHDVDALRRAVDGIVSVPNEAELQDFRRYLAALHRMITEMAAMADTEADPR